MERDLRSIPLNPGRPLGAQDLEIMIYDVFFSQNDKKKRPMSACPTHDEGELGLVETEVNTKSKTIAIGPVAEQQQCRGSPL